MNTLSINEDSADPDGTGTLSYSWQTSSDNSTWKEVGTNSTYKVTNSEQGKKIRAIVSYKDSEGFDEKFLTSSSNIALFDDGAAKFSINGTSAVGNTLSVNEDAADPDGNGTFTYSWQTSKIILLGKKLVLILLTKFLILSKENPLKLSSLTKTLRALMK